ncbi:hypothetical protein SAMD00019534_113600 [Acytostelium subglobosum LB1]|uniref:hypothetical protein n=1 Tax=Acytostelium subglobosum LB1 TaxID=1410327 RepID=UPI000644B1EC|nr:hypothetical protein SAMD00019534_113600 [Acytostelium subglobosum LB1]GAM28184.1 hypothetical protein SAMD00019534_113600 [Acytostelium subglobosum LB1]|eukprot:XP_012748818.1 hypothetical protein SAMD00019534_113600 [Acytostelium subglobosum LB1]
MNNNIIILALLVALLSTSSTTEAAETLYGLLTKDVVGQFNFTELIYTLDPSNGQQVNTLVQFPEALPQKEGGRLCTVDNKNNIMYSVYSSNGGAVSPILKSYIYAIDLTTRTIISHSQINNAPSNDLFVELDFNNNTGNLNCVIYNDLTGQAMTGHLTLDTLDIVIYEKVHVGKNNIHFVAAGYYAPENIYMVYYQDDSATNKQYPIKMYDATSGKVVRTVKMDGLITTMQYMPYFEGAMVLGHSGEIRVMDVASGAVKTLDWADNNTYYYSNQAVGESSVYLSAVVAGATPYYALITIDVTTNPPTVQHNVTNANAFYDQLIVSLN